MSDGFSVTCPTCGRQNDHHSGATVGAAQRGPMPGSLSLCWGCRTIGVFDLVDGHLAVRHATPEEQRDIAADPHLTAILAEISVVSDPVAAARRARDVEP